jgi:hypothetical protein
MRLLRLLLLVPPPDHAALSGRALLQRVVRKAALATSLVAIIGLANQSTGGQTLSAAPANQPVTNQSSMVELEVNGQ